MGVQKYVCRVKKAQRTARRHSTFHVGLHGRRWVDSVERHAETAPELIRLSPNKRKYYQQGNRAVSLCGLPPNCCCHPVSLSRLWRRLLAELFFYLCKNIDPPRFLCQKECSDLLLLFLL